MTQSFNSVMRKSSIIDDGNQETPMDTGDNGDQSLGCTIQKLFFGKLINILQVQSEKREKPKIFNEKVEKMGPIFLDVNNDDSLYDAW